jgi:hypothetical protein
MNWRKWLVRGLVFALAGGLGLLALLFQTWTSPTAVRQLVLHRLRQQFQGTVVSVAGARLRLFGGIILSDLRLARRDDLDQLDFFYAPSAVVYHDKEHLLSGKLGIRKIVLQRPRLRIVRQRDGTWNVQGLLRAPEGLHRCPTFVCKQGTLLFEDHSTPNQPATLEITDVDLSVINDPPTVFVFQGTGKTDVAGPITMHGRLWRHSCQLILQAQLPDIPVAPELLQRLAHFFPEASDHLRHLRGKGALYASLVHFPGQETGKWSHQVTFSLRDGEFQHPRLPFTLQQMQATIQASNGTIPRATLKARAGPTRFSLECSDIDLKQALASRSLASPHLEELARRIDLAIDHLPVSAALFRYLPEHVRWIDDHYTPRGNLSLRYTSRQPAADGKEKGIKRWTFRPEGMKVQASCFRYPVATVQGSLTITDRPAHPRQTDFALTGGANGTSVRLDGKVVGNGKAPEVDLVLDIKDLLLDDRIYQALPESSRAVAQQFLPEDARRAGLDVHPMGWADGKVFIRRAQDAEVFDNRFVIQFRDARVLYDHFPYPLEKVSGVLDIFPDRWECRNFHGRHGQGHLYVQAHSQACPGSTPATRLAACTGTENVVKVSIQGRNIRLDDRDFVRALTPRGKVEPSHLQKTWETLALAGQMNFAAEVLNRPGQPQDIDVGVEVRGCRMKPRFFPYALDEVSGQVRYARNKVYLTGFSARHDQATLGLRTGLITLGPEGDFQAWLKGLRASNLQADEALVHAVPTGLRSVLEPLALQEPFDAETDLHYRHNSHGPPQVWWEGGVALRGARFQIGVQARDVDGQFSTRGHHDGERLVGVEGDFLLDRITLLGQPLRHVHGRLLVRPDSPEVLRVHDLKGELFEGQIGGQARVEFGSTFQYEVLLEALGISLNRLGKHNLGTAANQAQLEGPMRASLYLKGVGKELSGLKGNGQVDIQEGKMGQLPVLLDLLKAIGLRVPDRTAFEQGSMQFRIEGPRLHIDQLDLYGNAISLRGAGTMNLDGSRVQLDFHADWGRVSQLLPRGIQEIPRAISDQLLRIKMRGDLGKGGKVRFDKEIVPIVAQPIKRVLGQAPDR